MTDPEQLAHLKKIGRKGGKIGGKSRSPAKIRANRMKAAAAAWARWNPGIPFPGKRKKK